MHHIIIERSDAFYKGLTDRNREEFNPSPLAGEGGSRFSGGRVRGRRAKRKRAWANERRR